MQTQTNEQNKGMSNSKYEKLLSTITNTYLKLPKADKSEIGAEYAAIGAALTSVIFFSTFSLLISFIIQESSRWLLGFALASLPFVVPSAFLSGILVWSFLPEEKVRLGFLGGATATIITYMFAAFFLGVFLAVDGAGIIDGFIMAFVIGWTAFLFTIWLTLPIESLVGSVHSRAIALKEE